MTDEPTANSFDAMACKRELQRHLPEEHVQSIGKKLWEKLNKSQKKRDN